MEYEIRYAHIEAGTDLSDGHAETTMETNHYVHKFEAKGDNEAQTYLEQFERNKRKDAWSGEYPEPFSLDRVDQREKKTKLR
jgi:hypothetical protein